MPHEAQRRTIKQSDRVQELKWKQFKEERKDEDILRTMKKNPVTYLPLDRRDNVCGYLNEYT